jgi:hypothetical protein
VDQGCLGFGVVLLENLAQSLLHLLLGGLLGVSFELDVAALVDGLGFHVGVAGIESGNHEGGEAAVDDFEVLGVIREDNVWLDLGKVGDFNGSLKVISDAINALFNVISSSPSGDIVVGLKSLSELPFIVLEVPKVLLNLCGTSPGINLGLDVLFLNKVFDVVTKSLDIGGNFLLVGVVDMYGGHRGGSSKS